MILTDIKAVMKNHHDKLLILIFVFPAWIISGCATTEKSAPSMQVTSFTNSSSEAVANDDFDLLDEEYAEKMVEVADPLEPFNRAMFHVNDTFYFWVVKPISQVYSRVVPEPARIGIRNFFSNITMPVRFVNCLLQGKGDAAGTELSRFTINTTAGILGFGDPARDEYGLEPVREDMGQTLGVYGFGDGFYLVLPLMGPSTLRDSVSRIGDCFLNPVFYLETTDLTIGISALNFANSSSFKIGEYETLKSMTVEPYIAIRDSYIQYRNKQIRE
jgi:phospholipid-binding lipoprotein MlaA